MWTKLIFCKVLTQCLLIITVSAGAAINYCSPNFCNNSKQHTLCRFRSPEPSLECIDYERTTKNKEQKDALLNKINSRRNEIASGDVRSFPTARNMMKLVWSEELEKSAQRWADQCVSENVPGPEDLCRDLGDIPVGQNVASVYGEAPGLSPMSLVDVWYMELLNINSSVVPYYLPSYRRGFSHYDYFTQLVWAISSEVGCASVKFKEPIRSSYSAKNRTVYRLVCNFAPSGNVLGEPVYDEGPPCSACPEGNTCDLTYSHLCSSIINTRQPGVTTTESENMEKFVLSDDGSKEENVESDDDWPIKDENSTILDYFSAIYDYSRQPLTTETPQTGNACNNSLKVDELVELLKIKLTTDPMFKELLSSKHPSQNGNTDSSYTDPRVAAFVNKIYSKKDQTTTTTSPEKEYVNSTLLVDLVEAVIFRSGDKTYATENTNDILSVSDVSPVKIQAELAEVRQNHDFTGHYFFPEDNSDESVQDTTDPYYDASNLPVSDVILEIESIKRDRVTQDFLEEIMDSDIGTDETAKAKRGPRSKKEIQNHYRYAYDYYNYDNKITVKYSDLLQRLASDLKLLQLNKRFHCSYPENNAKSLIISIVLRLTLTAQCFWIIYNVK